MKNIVVQSPQQFRVVQYPATSFSQNNANWHIISLSPDIIIARYIRVTIPLTLQINATVKNAKDPAYILNIQYTVFCQYPLHQMIATLLIITFNNTKLSLLDLLRSLTSSSITTLKERLRRLLCPLICPILTQLMIMKWRMEGLSQSLLAW